MPLYTLRNLTTGVTVTTTDPGLALSTGKWKDIGRFKGPVLRGLGARAPTSITGSRKPSRGSRFLHATVRRHLTDRQRKDLIAFLRTL